MPTLQNKRGTSYSMRSRRCLSFLDPAKVRYGALARRDIGMRTPFFITTEEPMSETRPSMRDSLTYRPDIDGLRAVAVVPVVLYHFRVPGFGGGYVGVDVFFVISGFLIT